MNNTVMKEYIPVQCNNNIKNNKTTHLKIRLYYSLGGINHWTNENESRGYYLSITPVECSNISNFMIEDYKTFSGTKVLVKEVNRKGRKSAEEALRIAEDMKHSLIDNILIEQGLSFA